MFVPAGRIPVVLFPNSVFELVLRREELDVSFGTLFNDMEM